MAHKKAGGSTSLGRESQSKRLGVKIADGQTARAGQIIIRQRGTKIHPGKNIKRGGDDTLYAGIAGVVKFSRRKVRKFNGNLRLRKYVNIVPQVKE
jgi:large subunit ribosomal protein L27